MIFYVKVLSLLVFLLCVSCAPGKPEIQYLKSKTIDAQFLQVIDIVKDRLKKFGVGEELLNRTDFVTIRFEKDAFFEEKHKNSEAVCTRSSKYNEKDNIIYLENIISIKKSIWYQPPHGSNRSQYITEMIAHELGHCIWGLKHFSEENQIMNENHSLLMSRDAWQNFAQQIIDHQHLFKDLDEFKVQHN